MKQCAKCKQNKQLEDFNRDKNKKDGRQGYCRDCNREKGRVFREKNPGYMKKWYDTNYHMNTYGISYEEYKAQSDKQEGKCLLCGRTPDTLFVDHCHASGKVRGLLCNQCNTGLGMFYDNTEVMRKAISYLEDSDDHSIQYV